MTEYSLLESLEEDLSRARSTEAVDEEVRNRFGGVWLADDFDHAHRALNGLVAARFEGPRAS